jgi:hypothetical protein
MISSKAFGLGFLATSLTITSAASRAAEVELTKGPITPSLETLATQPIAAKNTSGRNIVRLKVECGFFRDGAFIGTGFAVGDDVAPNQTAYFDVMSRAKGANSTECRVVNIF